MSTSEYGELRDFNPDRLGEDGAASTYHARDIFNRGNHAADQSAQVLVCFTAPIVETSTAGDNSMTGADVGADQWVCLWRSPPIPLRLHADGSPYRLVTRMRGHSTTGTQVDFRLLVSPSRPPAAESGGILRDTLGHDFDQSGSPDLGGDVYKDFSTTSTTIAVLTPSDGKHYVNADPGALRSLAASAVRSVPTLEDVGGDPAEVEVCEVIFEVYAKSADASTDGVLDGLHVREYAA